MPDINIIKFRRGDHEFHLSIGWDEDQLSEGVIDFPIEAGMTRIDGKDDGNISLTAHVSVEIDEKRGALLKVKIGGEEVFSESLANLFRDNTTAGRVLESIHSTAYGFGHPVVGCLVRAGLSASIGQIINCTEETAGTPWVRPRMLALGICLRHNIPNMLVKTLFRATRCVGRLGF